MVASRALIFLLAPIASALAQSSSSSTSSGFIPTPVPSNGSASVSADATGSASSSASATSSTSAFPSLSSYSPCVNNCLGLAIAQVGCDSFTDVNCFCPQGSTFPVALVGCVSTQCPGDLAAAENVSQLFCNVASSAVSLSFPTASASGGSQSSSSSSTTSSANTTTSSSSSSSQSSVSATTTPAPSQTAANQSSDAAAAFTQLSGLWTIFITSITLMLAGMTV